MNPTDRTESSHREYHDERDMDRFWAEIKPEREPMQQRWFIPLLLLLAVASVPWYLPGGVTGRIVGGLPIWVWTAVACSAGISTLTAVLAIRFWSDDEPDDELNPEPDSKPQDEKKSAQPRDDASSGAKSSNNSPGKVDLRP